MLPKTTPVTIRGDLEQRVTASGRLGASAMPVTPPPAATPARSATHRWPAPSPQVPGGRNRDARREIVRRQVAKHSYTLSTDAFDAAPQRQHRQAKWSGTEFR